jgi:hypothetical protein
MRFDLGAAFRIVAVAVALAFIATGCTASSGVQESAQGLSCESVLASTVQLIRAGQSGNGHDELTSAIEKLRTGGCPEEWSVFADYSSARGMAEQFGVGRCSELANYAIQPAAVRLLREDRLCKPGRGAQAVDGSGKAGPTSGIPWNEAGRYVGTRQRVCGPLSGIGRSADDVFLNIGRNYPDPQRFTIVLWDVGDVRPIPAGATLCASGPITSYKGVAQIELRSAGEVEVSK